MQWEQVYPSRRVTYQPAYSTAAGDRANPTHVSLPGVPNFLFFDLLLPTKLMSYIFETFGQNRLCFFFLGFLIVSYKRMFFNVSDYFFCLLFNVEDS